MCWKVENGILTAILSIVVMDYAINVISPWAGSVALVKMVDGAALAPISTFIMVDTLLVLMAIKDGGPLEVVVLEVKTLSSSRTGMPPVKEVSLSIWPPLRGATL